MREDLEATPLSFSPGAVVVIPCHEAQDENFEGDIRNLRIWLGHPELLCLLLCVGPFWGWLRGSFKMKAFPQQAFGEEPLPKTKHSLPQTCEQAVITFCGSPGGKRVMNIAVSNGG